MFEIEFSWVSVSLVIIGVAGLIACINLLDKVIPKYKDSEKDKEGSEE